VRCDLWKVESSIGGLRGQKRGLCLEGNRLCHNFLFTLWKFLQDLWMNGTHRTVAKTMIKKSGRCHTNWRLSEQVASCDSQPGTGEAEEVQYRCADVLGSLCLETSRTVLQACHKDNPHIKSPPESFSKSLLRISRLTSAVAESGQQHALAYQTPRSIFLCHFLVLGQTKIAVVRYSASFKWSLQDHCLALILKSIPLQD
jgi:hypothetical protein